MQKIPQKRLAQLKDFAMFAFVITCILFTVGMLIWSHFSIIGRWLEWQALRERGVSISAQVISLERINSTRSEDSCAVLFAYQSETGATLSRETRTTSDFCAIFSPGSIVEALYLPEDPTIADLTWASGYVALQVFMLIVVDGVLLLAFGWVWLKAWLETRLKSA
jgi:hypothetical protein